jgi:hypothetical protein
MSEHYDDGEPLDPSMLDEERFRNLIELGLVNLNHSDRERADRFLRAGAAFVARSVGDDVEIALEFTRETAKLAAARAAVWGDEPEPVRDEDRGQIVPIFKAPLKALRRPPRVERQPGD